MDQIKIGAFIAKKRKEKNLTQEQLAQRLGVSNKSVSKWECGRCMPDYSVIELLCKELDVSIAQIFNGDDSISSSAIEDEKIQSIFNSMRQSEKLNKINKLIIIGILLIVIGIASFGISFAFKGSEIQDFTRGFFRGLSAVQVLLGASCTISYAAVKISSKRK
ncbi:MAG: helix-turn-helix transcriptional regulator [Clostridia bacterium]|jgi:transcriptional regulator with XRE-family HTH domain|nr:helix-turn-helix transcriptional regulator [Clostridia bacterium]